MYGRVVSDSTAIWGGCVYDAEAIIRKLGEQA
jgi:hypothetical protein